MSIRYNGSEYNEASGTRDAFGRFSDDLVAAGLPPVVVVSADRAPRVQVAIFVDRFRQQASGSGPFGDVRWWDGSAWGYPGGTRWVRWSSAGTVAVPGTGNHEKKRSNDLGWPYNAVTTAHLRAREIAARHNITCDGLGFGEAWHWTFWGALGVIGAPASDGNATPIQSEEDDMYDDNAKKDAANRHADQMRELSFLRPLKLYALVDENGAGGWVWIGPSGRWWTVPSPAYAILVEAQKLSQAAPIRAMLRAEFDFLTNQLLGGLVPDGRNEYRAEVELSKILKLDSASVDSLVEGIKSAPLVLTADQFKTLAEAVGAAARTNGETGAVQALTDLTLVASTA